MSRSGASLTTGNCISARRPRFCLALAVVLGWLLPTVLHAQMPTPPEIQLTSHGRGITLTLSADNSSTNPGGSVGETRITSAPNSGPFVVGLENEFVGDGGARAYGLVTHESVISTFKIEGESHLELEANNGPNDAQGGGEARSEIFIQFMVPEDATFQFKGTLETTSSEFAVPAQAMAVLTGNRPDSSFFFFQEQFNSQFNSNPVNFFHTETVQGSTLVSLQVQSVLVANSVTVPSVNQTADFTFELNFGDTDGDGLLDIWESAGIDVNNDSIIDINLPNMGADPLKKDLFVELDALSGAWQSSDATAINEVINAFANAPAVLVDNPNNSMGINLHVDIDETNITFGQPSGVVTGLGSVDMLKADHFGSPADRQKTYWEDLKEARERVYRYCAWVSLLADSGMFPTGRAEKPGNDFLVAADRARTVFSQSDTEGALAGTFMHELGHTLGLEHGGTDTLEYKPNYLSVMSYMYQGPHPGTESAFYLDYSTTTMAPLYEKELDETRALNGPPYKHLMYNSAPDGQAPVRTVVYADAPNVDWNLDGAFDSLVTRNVSAINPPDSTNQFFLGATDWNRLWYHLSGHGNFDDGLARDPASVPVELPGAQIEAIGQTPFVDLTTTTGVADVSPTRPPGLRSWPNPFSPRMAIRFELDLPRDVDLAVYNVQGQRVRVLAAQEPYPAGSHDVAWDGTDDAGRRVPGGLYFVRMQAGNRTEQLKVLRVH